ncbi:MAG: multidrug transporter [Porticoccaceae bacterium]|nr:MAG: multidrug transporter [Porticoccaceae bacterium]
MILSDLAVRRPTLALVANLLLVVFGLVAYQLIPLRQYPDTDPPVVSITTSYRGAAADIVDTRITRILEEQLSGLEGIKYIDSVSRDGTSSITIEFEIERDVDAAVNEVQQAVSRVADELPEEADLPRVAKADTNARPIMWFNLVSDRYDALALSDLARRLVVDRLSIVDGVARVIVSGEKRYAMRVELDPLRLAAHGLTPLDVEERLRAENVELPAGALESEGVDLPVRLARRFGTPEAFARLPVGYGSDGALVRLGEVAHIRVGAEREEALFRREGQPMVGIGIVKQSRANTVAVAEAVKEAVARLRPQLPEGVSLQDSYDASVFVSRAVAEVYETLAVAVVLVVAVIWLFLQSGRATLVPAATVPIALISTFLFVWAVDFTVNLLTLLALVLAIGLVVDDTIVVLENIHHRMQRGEPPLLAAYRGARQVGFAVVATTAVSVAVFVPLVFLQGNVGKLFTEFALTLAAAVVFSSFVALTLSPVLASRFLVAAAPEPNGCERFLQRLEGAYRGALEGFARRLAPAVAVIVVCLGLSALLLHLLPAEFAPEEDSGTLFLSFRGPDNASFERTERTVLEMERAVLEHFDELALDRFLIAAPAFFGNTSNNTAFGIVALRPWEERDLSAQEVRNRLYQLLGRVPGGRAFLFSPSALTSGGSGRPVQVVVGGDTYEELAAWRERLLARLAGEERLANVDVDFSLSSRELAVLVDVDRAAALGVPAVDVARTLETLLGGRLVTTYTDRGEEYEVLVEAPNARLAAPADLAEVWVRSRTGGALVPLANLVQIAEESVSPELPRYNRRRALTLSADPAPGHSLGEALEAVEEAVREVLPDSATLDYKGESLEFVRSQGSVAFVFAVAVIVSYLVLAAQFESFLHPLLILLTVPTAAVGALAGLAVTGQTLNIFSQIALVMLVGLAAKNGVLIVEFANQLRDAGVAFREAVFQAAARRLRPILMTSLTTLFGAVPLIAATGAGAEVRFVIGVAVFAGVLASTLLTLFVLPALYLHLAEKSATPGRVRRRLAELGAD